MRVQSVISGAAGNISKSTQKKSLNNQHPTGFNQNAKPAIAFGSFSMVSPATIAKKFIPEMSVNFELKFIKAQFEDLIREFPQDLPYYRKLASDMGLKTGEEFRLLPITGKAQLQNILKTASKEDFDLGYDFSGVKNLTHRISLHNHTELSDGKVSIEEFLENAVAYANKLTDKNPHKPYVVAITDHDIMDEGKALKIIAQDPYKYRNLKFVTGSAEISTSHANPDDVKEPLNFEVILLAGNPFNKEFNAFLKNLRDNRIKTAKIMLDEINQKFPQLNLNWLEASKFSANLAKGTSNGSLWLARDYAVFKSYLKMFTDIINEKIIKDPSKKLNADDIMKKLANDYYEKSDQRLAGGGIDNYFKLYGIGDIKPDTSELKEVFDTKLSESQIKEINQIRDNHLKSASSMINPEITVTPEQIFEAYRKSGDAGMFGVAHPGLLQAHMYSDKIADYCKNTPNTEPAHHLIWILFNRLKQAGKELFQFSESNYQSYGTTPERASWIDYMSRIAEKLNLLKSGGVDSHTKSLFSKHKPLTPQELLEMNMEPIAGAA